MEETFARRLTEAQRAGLWQVARVWWRELAGLLALALSERMSRTGPAKAGYYVSNYVSNPRTRTHRRPQGISARPKAGVMDTTTQEIRQAVRRLVRTPAFT